MINHRITYFILLLLAIVSCSDAEVPIEIKPEPVYEPNPNPLLFEGRKWSVETMPTGLSNGSLQGAALYKDKIYQFKNTTSNGRSLISYDTYDIKTGVWTPCTKALTCVPQCHAGSACFIPGVYNSYTANGETFQCTLPFVLLTGHYEAEVRGKYVRYEIVDVVDIENDRLVRRYTFPNRNDDAIAAYDFDNNKMWLIGYKPLISGMSPYIIEEYDVDFVSLKPSKINFTSDDIVSTVNVGGPNKEGIQETLACGTLQDADFHNGYIYLAVGRVTDYTRTEWSKVHAYDTYTRKIVSTIICPDNGEPEGLLQDGNNMYLTTSNRVLWKLAKNPVYDNTYNFQPAQEIATDSFLISNGSQLVWFMSQVYNGRTKINGTLINDIDMNGITDPFTFYIYDTNIFDGYTTDGRKFESHYAYRGIFDGQGHTVSNFNISKTPYYNNGLFPYAVNATIKNITVSGNITCTTAKHASREQYDIKNVGLIGYMYGGNLDNIDVSKLSIDTTKVYTSTNINPLIGSANGKITYTNCITK